MTMRLAIVTTHPIQYYAPVFKLLHERGKIHIHVFYSWGEQVNEKFDPGFGQMIRWDIPLLEGYPYSWAENRARDPGTHHFNGIVTPGLVRQIENWKPDAVLFIGWSWRGHLKAIRYFKKSVPVFFRGDSTLIPAPAPWKSALRYLILKWVYASVDFAFYVGQHNLSYFKRFGLTDDQLGFAPHAVDNTRFAMDSTREATELRLELGIGPQEIVILYAGKFEPVKNISLLVSAFTGLDLKGVHLLLVGQGPLKDQLMLMSGSSTAGSRIHFMDFQNQTVMPSIYQACDLFCLPSRSETWGLAVNEAMACGKAVLVSDRVGCAPDLVKDHFNGLVFRSSDQAHLQACLADLTGSREKLDKLGANSREIIQQWSFVQIAIAIENKLLQDQ
jgi:glycosyltransferase involved in cell wall biosynthesis